MTASLAPFIEIVEVGPRDGLQDEPTIVSTADKVAYIEAALRAGVRRVEVASFAHPARVPTMADAEAVIAALGERDGVRFAALVLNERGMDRAIASGIGEVNDVVVVTEAFSRQNQAMTTAAAMASFVAIARRAGEHGIRPTITLAAAFGCPFEGRVEPRTVVALAQQAAEAGAVEIALADTIGCAVPTQVEDLIAAVCEATGVAVRAHLHNSRNTGLANAVAAIRGGAHALDSSLGGIGGCPFAPGATGNVPTEDLAHMLDGMGIHTGLDIDRLLDGVAVVEGMVGHPVPGMLARCGRFPRS